MAAFAEVVGGPVVGVAEGGFGLEVRTTEVLVSDDQLWGSEVLRKGNLGLLVGKSEIYARNPGAHWVHCIIK